MKYKQLIADSWRFTQENKKLIYWFGFFPSVLSTTIGIGYLAYQFFSFKKSFLFDNSETSFLYDVSNFGWDFVSTHATLTVPLIVFAAIVAVLWLLVPTLSKAASFQAIARAKSGQKSGVGVGLKYGLMAFLPLFEFHLLVKTFTPISIITEMGFVLRNLGWGIFNMMIPVFILILVVSFVLSLLFTYADLYIVIDGEGVLSSMKKSAKLVILNWQHTVLITILMIIIGVRIIIQALLIFLVPAVAILAGGYLATLALETAMVVVMGIVGVSGLLLSAYLGGVVDIFAYTVWTYTFLELTSQGEISARGDVSAGPKVVDTSARTEIAQPEAEPAPEVGGMVEPKVEPPLATGASTVPDAEISPQEKPVDLQDSDDSIPGLL